MYLDLPNNNVALGNVQSLTNLLQGTCTAHTQSRFTVAIFYARCLRILMIKPWKVLDNLFFIFWINIYHYRNAVCVLLRLIDFLHIDDELKIFFFANALNPL